MFPIRSSILGAAAILLAVSESPAHAMDIQDAPRVNVVTGYTRLLSALTSGRDVTVVVRFKLCTVAGTANRGPALTGGFHIGEFLALENQYVAFSNVHETLSPENERLTEFVRYRVMPDGRVSIRTTNEQHDGSVGRSAEYSCAIGTGVEVMS